MYSSFVIKQDPNKLITTHQIFIHGQNTIKPGDTRPKWIKAGFKGINAKNHPQQNCMYRFNDKNRKFNNPIRKRKTYT